MYDQKFILKIGVLFALEYEFHINQFKFFFLVSTINNLELDWGSIRSSQMYGLGTPYRFAFFNGPKNKIDDGLLEHVGLPYVLPHCPPGLGTPSKHSTLRGN